MLKTLRITSRVVLALAVCGVVFMVFLGLRGDSDITAYLQNPGIVQQFQDKVSQGDKKESQSPLVVKAHEFALRIDPPPPPPPPQPIEQPKVNPDVVRVVERQEPPRPKVAVSAKFELLATVQCETDPSRSMVLLKQATGKEEWFWLGENVGHLKIDDVRNGSAIFSQDGRNPQELFVPVKPQAKSLLKGEQTPSVSSSARPGSIDIQLGENVGSSTTASGIPSLPEANRQLPSEIYSGDSSRIRRLRTGDVTASAPAVRAEPRQPTPEEQKASLEESISGIQEIMSHQDSGMDEQQRQKENEVWLELLSTLQNEKENLESVTESTGRPQPNDAEEGEGPILKNDPNGEE